MIRSILTGYGLVFFSPNPYVGVLFMSATLVIPSQGMAGLGSLLLSNGWATVLGFPREDVRQGYYAYNGLLTGLALGMTYQLNGPFVLMILIASLLGVLIAASLQALFRHYLFIPVLSTPFVLTTWLVLAADQHFHGLIYTLEPFEATFLVGVFPEMFDFFLRSLGATFFQLTGIAGLLIAAGLLLYSRFAFILGVVGLVSGSLVYSLLKGDPADLHRNLIGFNFILTAVAVGGVWTIPGPGTLMLAAAGSALCAMVSAATTTLLAPLSLPALAFPFIATTCILLYSLKQRGGPSRFQTIVVPEKTPELNIKRQRSARTRFLDPQVPAFVLPVSGEWTITQGPEGEHTHKQVWSRAWDFEIHDESGRPCRGQGAVVEDFYAFNMPVYAPADGKVIAVVNHIEDNPIGQVNTEDNWGNLIIVWHYGRVYTAYCHLRRGTAAVSGGELVRQGQLIGKVGNSGRSTVPHLHFHVQRNPDIGAAAVEAELLHFLTPAGSVDCYHTHGVPGQGDRIKPLSADDRVFRAAGFPLGRKWTYELSCGGKAWREEWETEIDFSGNRFLVCKDNRSRIRYTVNRYVLLLLDYEGPPDTGLYWLFLGVPRLPMTSVRVEWRDELDGGLMLPRMRRLLSDLFEPFHPLARVQTVSRLDRSGSNLVIQTELAHKGLLAGKRFGKVRVCSEFDSHEGLVSVDVEAGAERMFSLRRNENPPPPCPFRKGGRSKEFNINDLSVPL
jgi:urea transporter